MQYRQDKHAEDISALGYGCLRFTKKGNSIDIDKAEKEILLAIEKGVNYFDTAYTYSGSESALGEIVSRNNLRSKIKIATKLPPYLVRNISDVDRIFNEELSRLKTDYVDYYLMHMLTDVLVWEKLKALGIEEWFEKQKAAGRIKNVGFSYHGNTDMFLKLIDAYDWDMTQIQYNYLDEHTQAGRKGLEAAFARKIPVVIMEPLRGGKLVNMLPAKAVEIMKNSPRNYSAAEWGLKWLWNQQAVTCILSGMNSLEMVEENCRIADEARVGCFNEEDEKTLNSVKEAILEKTKVSCTACGYCMPCPKGVDIPGTFSCYNHMFTENKKAGRFEFFQTIGLRKKSALPSLCVECGKCEMHCPQNVPIRAKLKEADKALLPWYYRVGIFFAKIFFFGLKRVDK